MHTRQFIANKVFALFVVNLSGCAVYIYVHDNSFSDLNQVYYTKLDKRKICNKISSLYTKDKRIMNTKTTKQELFERYEADRETLCSETFSADPERGNFNRTLSHNADYNDMIMRAHNKFREPLSKVFGRFNCAEWFFVGFIGFLPAAMAYVATREAEQPKKLVVTKKTNMQNLAHEKINVKAIALAFVLGLLAGTFCIIGNARSRRDDDVQGFYDRLILHYMRKAKAQNPDLDETIFKKLNPKLCEMIAGLLMMNMDSKDTKRIITYIDRLSNARFADNADGVIQELAYYEFAIEKSVPIIEQALAKNPELNKIIIDAFRGNIPTMFVLEQNQRQGR